MVRYSGIVALVVLASVAQGADKAATSELPVGLQALHIADSAVITEEAARTIRGQSLSPSPFLMDFGFDLGLSAGAGGLLEDRFANFAFEFFGDAPPGGSALTLEGTLGGLTGSLGGTAGGLTFELSGKAFQESFQFMGKFEQQFGETLSR
jgi:hypothetical protein